MKFFPGREAGISLFTRVCINEIVAHGGLVERLALFRAEEFRRDFSSFVFLESLALVCLCADVDICRKIFEN